MGVRLNGLARLVLVGIITAAAALPLFGQVSRVSPFDLQTSASEYRASRPAITDRAGLVDDWSGHHLLYSRPSLFSPGYEAIEHEPRYWLQQINRAQQAHPELVPLIDGVRPRVRLRRQPLRRTRLSRDWSFSLGSNATGGAGSFPAKFSFSTTTASCTSDFVVYNTGVPGIKGGEPNIVAFNNLYSGCGGTVPTVAWAYQTGSGKVLTSPTLSLDGTKVAFIENAKSGAVLRILKWKNGQGVFSASRGNWSSAAVDNTTLTSWSSCGATQSCMISLTLSGNTQSSNSPPFYNFANDTLYVGDDSGLIHRFNGVFNGTPAEVRSNFPVMVNSGATLTGPAYDGVSGNIFVADSTGILWYVRETGSTVGSCTTGDPPCLGATSVDVGSGSREPIVDGPMVDPSTQEVFAFTGCSLSEGGACTAGSAFGQVVQATTALTGVVRANLGAGSNVDNLRDGAFDNNYLLGNFTTGHLYSCGNPASTQAKILYNVGFDSAGVMNTTSTTGPTLTSAASINCSAVTEVDNAGTDRIFFSVPSNGTAAIATGGPACTGSCVYSYDVTSGNLTPGATASNGLTAVSGSSAIVIDNTATTPTGASQIYFSTLANGTCATSGGTGGCAVQASQAGLQ